nr:MAG TPA: hypothetical protein [Caudoviricetes sp.]
MRTELEGDLTPSRKVTTHTKTERVMRNTRNKTECRRLQSLRSL